MPLDWLIAHPVAHRGLHDVANGVIENTAGAFRAAIAAGYAIETDVQISADGEAMVHHDDVLGRLTEGEGRLDTFSASALKRVPFRGSSEHMMTLSELCDLVAGRVTLAGRAQGPVRRRRAAQRARRRRARALFRPGRGHVVRPAPGHATAAKSAGPRARHHRRRISTKIVPRLAAAGRSARAWLYPRRAARPSRNSWLIRSAACRAPCRPSCGALCACRF